MYSYCISGNYTVYKASRALQRGAVNMGMTSKEYQEKTQELIFYFLVAPAIILVGMASTGAILDGLLHTPQTESVTFAKIFTGVGGIPGIVVYFHKLWNDFAKKAEIKP